MAQTLECKMLHEDAKNDTNTLPLRTTVTFSDDDLSDEAKKQFPFQAEILSTFRFFADHVLSNAELSQIGRHLVCTTLERNYMNSKLVLNYIACHPELKMTPDVLPHPLVLCGLPRSGTTLLYNLLSCDPACRAPLYADIVQPVPPISRSDTVGQTQRNNALQGLREMFKTFGLNDNLEAMRASHPQFTIEEDQYLFHHVGYNWLHAMFPSSDDNELMSWAHDSTNKNFLYEYHKTFFKMLNSIDAPYSHWLFKAPHHMLYLDEFLHHYPSAMLVMTHRRLDHVLPSFGRLAIAYAGPYFDKNKDNAAINMQTIVNRAFCLMDEILRSHVEFRRSRRNVPYFDIQYDDLVAQPIDTVRRLYNHFGLAWSKEFERAMAVWLRDNPQGKQGRNSYTLSDYGITLDEIEIRYKDYISMFLNSQYSSNDTCSMTKSQAQ